MKKTFLILFLMSALLILTQPCHAGLFFISPGGSPLDADPILDIQSSPGSTLIFDIFLDTTGNLTDLTEFSYQWDWDLSELELITSNSSPPGGISPAGALFTVIGPSEGRYIISPQLNTVTPDQLFLVGRLEYQVLNGLTNDGIKDLGLTATSELGSFGGEISTFDANGLEVQPGDPVIPEPATMLLFGGGMVGAVLRRRKQA